MEVIEARTAYIDFIYKNSVPASDNDDNHMTLYNADLGRNTSEFDPPKVLLITEDNATEFKELQNKLNSAQDNYYSALNNSRK